MDLNKRETSQVSLYVNISSSYNKFLSIASVSLCHVLQDPVPDIFSLISTIFFPPFIAGIILNNLKLFDLTKILYITSQYKLLYVLKKQNFFVFVYFYF